MITVDDNDVAKTLSDVSMALKRIAEIAARYDSVLPLIKDAEKLIDTIESYRTELYGVLNSVREIKLITWNEVERIKDFINKFGSTPIAGKLLIVSGAIDLHNAAPCRQDSINVNLVTYEERGLKISSKTLKCSDVRIRLMPERDGLYIYIYDASSSFAMLILPIYASSRYKISLLNIMSVLLSKDLINRIIEVINAYAEYLGKIGPNIINVLQTEASELMNMIAITRAIINALNEVTSKINAIEHL